MYSTCNPIILLGYCMMGGWGGGLAIYFHLSWIYMFLFLLKAYGMNSYFDFRPLTAVPDAPRQNKLKFIL